MRPDVIHKVDITVDEGIAVVVRALKEKKTHDWENNLTSFSRKILPNICISSFLRKKQCAGEIIRNCNHKATTEFLRAIFSGLGN